jgi:hypothetical protein
MVPYVPDQQINTGSFVPTTNIWDVGRFYEVDIKSPEFKEMIVRLYQNINNISVALNTKDSAFYLTEEFLNGQVYFNPTSSNVLDLRPGFRKLVNIGALGAGIKTVAHGLTVANTWKFTNIAGAASNTATLNYDPLPFAGAAGNNIEVRVDGVNVIVTNNSGATFTDAYVILTYVKS